MLLSLTMESVRIFLHVLAATVWVGGQLVLGALVPALRGYEGVTKTAARRFNVVAWPAFAVLVLTGVWNQIAWDDPSDAARMTLNVKMGFVVLSGVAAFLHGRSKSTAGIAAWGAVGLVAALVSLFFGVQIAL